MNVTLPPVSSARSLAQQRRRQRERDSGAARDTSNHRLGQQRRRAREREQRAGAENIDDRRRRVPIPAPGHASALHQMSVARRPLSQPLPRHDLGDMDDICPHCSALHWHDERAGNTGFGMCCNHGKVQLDILRDPPETLRALLTDNNVQSKEFKENIWKYNRAFAFTSLGVSEDHSINHGNSPPVFRVQGELCHLAGSLLPTDGSTPVYSQLYIYEPREAAAYRALNNLPLSSATIHSLEAMLHDTHSYARIYRNSADILRQVGDVPDRQVILRVISGTDRRTHNLPTADEVAVILPGDQSEGDSRDIVLRKRDGPLIRISDRHPAYCPLQYPLLFPFGEHGWHDDLYQVNVDTHCASSRKISQTRYAAFRLQARRTEFSTILLGRRLLQRYMVDLWASADQARLSYLRNNQDHLRSSLYKGLEDIVDTADQNDINLHNIGTRTILPSSYIGGPRHMQQQFQDSMAIARYFRKVDLFITMTANPQWPEIVRALPPGLSAYDRPDLVVRVFQMKKNQLIRDIYNDDIFGPCVAYVYSIEFQKRGLPHIHLLLFLKDGYKLSTVDDIDSTISAVWPDPLTQPQLFATVSRCMVHGPCGALNPNAPCMENGKCTKRYPKPFAPVTIIDEDGYPRYRRPDDGRSFLVQTSRGPVNLDNRNIVPHTPYLSEKYDCHINVECAVSLGSFKYAFKYISKGSDRITFEIHRQDEIARHLSGRYISATEAAWRIFHFSMHNMVPNVVRLPVHLPGHHLVTFDPDDDPHTVLARAALEKTQLTAFFDSNKDTGELGAAARQHIYPEFPQFFVWKGDHKVWAVRQRGWAIGRMYFVPPNAGERFYLRTLLTIVKGPTSFKDLCTFNNVVYPTFEQTCAARGLLANDEEWRQCLEEASLMQTGSRLRHLFATILLFCEPSQPGLLWNRFRDNICDDLQHRLSSLGIVNPTTDDTYDYGLYLLDNILSQSSRSIIDWTSMPQPVQDWAQRVDNMNPLIVEQLAYDAPTEALRARQNIGLLNTDQRVAYDTILQSVQRSMGHLFFLHGPGGTGKTFIYNLLCNACRGDSLIVLCVASSGIAALLLTGGRTAHSMFKIPVDGLTAESFCAIPKQSHRADLIRRTHLIIWDEAGPQHKHAAEAFDRSCRDIRDTDTPFGGITVVFGGDFQQTLPIVPRGTRHDIIDSCLQHSYLWQHVHVLHLRENMRLRDSLSGGSDSHFAQWLLDIGHGTSIPTRDDAGPVPLPPDLITTNFSDLITFVYSGVGSTPPPPPEYFLNRSILAARNTDVAETNQHILDSMSGEEHIFYSADSIITESGADTLANDVPPVPTEFLRSITSSSLPPGELHLKIGCPLILLRNLAPTQGLCNGTRLVVTRVSERVLEVQILGGKHHGSIAFIPRISVIPTDTREVPFKFRRRQFPVRLAFAMTINKAQGQSVKYVGLDLRVPVFAHGQLYVALSRVTSRHRLKILLPEGNISTTTNVVYTDVLLI